MVSASTHVRSRKLYALMYSALIAVLIAAILPVVVNKHLRLTYSQTLAHWLSKFHSPNAVLIGDSLTAGLRSYDLNEINLGSNGLQSYQIAANLQNALAYDPKVIFVMMGTNDAIEATLSPPTGGAGTSADLRQERLIRSAFRDVCSNERVVLILAPNTTLVALNSEIHRINRFAVDICRPYGTPIVRLNELNTSDGFLDRRYTTDGVHLNSAGKHIVFNKLDEYR